MTSDDLGNLAAASKLVWACTCGQGGTAFHQGTTPAAEVLQAAVTGHLRARSNDNHRVDIGLYVTSAQLSRDPVPLVWSKA